MEEKEEEEEASSGGRILHVLCKCRSAKWNSEGEGLTSSEVRSPRSSPLSPSLFLNPVSDVTLFLCHWFPGGSQWPGSRPAVIFTIKTEV